MTPENIDVNQVVKEAITEIDTPSGIDIAINLGNIPHIQADPDQILRVLINLVTNGAEAMPKGGVVSIESHALRDYVEVSISDSGIGIEEEIMGKLFTPLFSTKNNGVGLGLYLSKGIVDAHGGSIEFNSKVGEGSTFTIRLPSSQKA